MVCKEHDTDEEDVSPDSVTLDAKEETCCLKFSKEWVKGAKLILNIDYTGELNDRLVGFYRSQYTSSDGTKKHLATTQFEACDARKPFPVRHRRTKGSNLPTTSLCCVLVCQIRTRLSTKPFISLSLSLPLLVLG